MKRYIKPETNTICVDMDQTMAATSFGASDSLDNTNTITNGSQFESKKHGNGLWDYPEEEDEE